MLLSASFSLYRPWGDGDRRRMVNVFVSCLGCASTRRPVSCFRLQCEFCDAQSVYMLHACVLMSGISSETHLPAKLEPHKLQSREHGVPASPLQSTASRVSLDIVIHIHVDVACDLCIHA